MFLFFPHFHVFIFLLLSCRSSSKWNCVHIRATCDRKCSWLLSTKRRTWRARRRIRFVTHHSSATGTCWRWLFPTPTTQVPCPSHFTAPRLNFITSSFPVQIPYISLSLISNYSFSFFKFSLITILDLTSNLNTINKFLWNRNKKTNSIKTILNETRWQVFNS